MNFRYRAHLKDGRSDIGVFEAASKQDALRQLAFKGLSVFELNEAKTGQTGEKPKAPPAARRFLSARRVDFSTLFADLAVLTEAGLTVTQSLRSMRSTENAPIQRRTIVGLLDKMSAGASATAAFAEIETIPPESLAMISSGENAGRLPEVFGAMAQQFEARAKLKSELLNALGYPIFLLALMFLAICVLTFVLVPAIEPVFENSGQPTPFIVATLSGLRRGLSGTVATALLGSGLLLLLLSILPQFRAPFGSVLQRIAVGIPLVGSLVRKSAQARYLASFALLIGNGTAMAKALELSALSSAVAAFTPTLLNVRDKVSAGERLAGALEGSGLFDQRIVSLIAVGDEANRLPLVASRAARILENEVQSAITRYTAMLTPAMTIVMGLLIGGLVVSVMTALLSINEIAIQ
jgi:general secretion pathway protein F